MTFTEGDILYSNSRRLLAYREPSPTAETWSNGGWGVSESAGQLINEATATGKTITHPSGKVFVEARVRDEDQHVSGFLGIGGHWVSGDYITVYFLQSEVTNEKLLDAKQLKEQALQDAVESLDAPVSTSNTSLTASGGGLLSGTKWWMVAIPVVVMLIGLILYLFAEKKAKQRKALAKQTKPLTKGYGKGTKRLRRS